MVEVFRTNVTDQENAQRLLAYVHATFPGCTASFDLDDCDHVLRVESGTEPVPPDFLIQMFNEQGYAVEILSDETCGTSISFTG